ncbi:expressed unknown protein [Seminavis robusta]|uniref:Uncharacterized protein n=1 Tax=Seminavis robusta TaxID=568900 RepID=A0A9N8HJS8_9STRA|nr:expressed unknown protein [Seminavis robusta]|eukprot:Sro709_g190810.1 n/a (192) ;mRNA; r:11720-12295
MVTTLSDKKLSPVFGTLAFVGAILAYFYQDAVSNGVKITVRRSMSCTAKRAFQAVSDFDVMPKISSDILKYDFVDDPPMHLNMRFSETRKMGSSDVLVTNLQVTEYDNNDKSPHARMVADTHGTIWDTTFDVVRNNSSGDQEVILEIAMHARAHQLMPKLLNPIMQVLFRFGLNSHIDQVKIWCEKEQQEK